MSKCSGVEAFRSVRPQGFSGDPSLLKDILVSLAANNDAPQLPDYVREFQAQFIVPLVLAAVCFVSLVVISVLLCRNGRGRSYNKPCCRTFYLADGGLLLVGIALSIYFTGAITSSLLTGSCQLEHSRVKAEQLVTGLNQSVVNITDSLDGFVAKVVNSLGDTPPSTVLNDYTASLDDLYDYASDTPCALPECLTTYFCSLCLNADPVKAVSDFVQSEVTPVALKNEEYLQLIDTNFVQAKATIQEGLDGVSSVKTTLLTKEGAWGELSALLIDTTYEAHRYYWTTAVVYLFLVAALLLSVRPSRQKDFPRLNCLSYLTCSSVILLLCFCAVALPLLTVSNDACAVMNALPNELDDYYDGEDVLEVVTQCFGDGKLPEKYLSKLDFVNTVGDCPQGTTAFENIPSGTLRAAVDTMGSFTTAEIAAQLNPVYKQRMADIMQIKQLAAVTYEREELLKDTVGTSLNNAVQICTDVEPLFELVKAEIYGFSCQAVGEIYYTTLGSVCDGVLDNCLNLTITLYAVVVYALAYYVGVFGYFVSDDGYRRL